MGHDEDLQTVFVAASISEADVVRGLLRANGIPAMIQDETALSMLDGMLSGSRGVRVVVAPGDLDLARRVIDENHRPAGSEEE